MRLSRPLLVSLALSACKSSSPSPGTDPPASSAVVVAAAPSAPPAAPASASASASAPAASAAPASSAPGLKAMGQPWAADRGGGGVLVAGARREGGGVLVQWRSDDAWEQAPLEGFPERPQSVEVVAGKGGLAVQVEDAKGQGKLWRATSWEGLKTAQPEDATMALCGLDGWMLGLGGTPRALRRWSYGEGPPTLAHELKGGAASLRCGSKRAYVTVEDGKTRTILAIEDQKVMGPFALDTKDDDHDLAVAVAGDALYMVRLGSKGEISLRQWPSNTPAPTGWTPLKEKIDEGASVELLLAQPPLLMLATSRHVDADSCKNGETSHTVVEARIIDTEKRAARPRTRVDLWACGADPGALGGGASSGGFWVTWPRGVGSACAGAGARHGGIGVQELRITDDRAERVKPRPIEVPSSDLIDLGCEEGRCGAVVLARGDSGGCWPADDERSNRASWVEYGQK